MKEIFEFIQHTSAARLIFTGFVLIFLSMITGAVLEGIVQSIASIFKKKTK